MMTTHRRRTGITASAIVAAGFIALAAAAPALSATNDQPSTMIRKSVQTLMDPDGTVQASRLYTQIQSTGNGQVTFTDPTSGSLRNLNGFGTPPVSDGTASFNFSVDGLLNQRTLQDYVKGDLPIKVKVEATLDGQPISPNDIVGKTGLLKMTYTITNDTSVDQEIVWKDGTGQTQTKTVPVPIPYVGSFATVLSDSYANIVAPGASVGGTGRNSTQLSYNLLLYKPLGDTTVVVKFEANVTNADIPTVDMTFLPAGPAENASTAALQEQIKGGAESGTQITDAGSQIDSNLLKLAAGAGLLNAGLLKLETGATTLSTGLNDTALPGANKLADGSKQVADGVTTAQSGADQLAAGSALVADGSTTLADGNAALAAGLNDLNDGLTLLKAGLNQLPPGLTQVNQAIAGVITGIGSPGNTGITTLLGGLNNVKWGLRNPVGYGSTDCAVALGGGRPTACGAMDAVQYISGALTSGATNLNALKPLFTALWIGSYGTTACTGGTILPPTTAPPANYCDAVATLYYSLFATSGQAPPLGGAQAQVAAAAGALVSVYGGVDGQIIPGINNLKLGLSNTACNLSDPTNPANPCGIKEVLGLAEAGVTQLLAGSQQLVAGVGTASSGCDPTATLACAGAVLQAGAAQLSAGATTLEGGAGQVAAGNKDLAAGLATLSNGADQVAAGNEQLATGLAPAAAGAAQIADGLGKATPGGTQIEDGANQLSAQGSKLLIAKGNETANSYGEQYALMEALNKRSLTQAGVPNGPADGSAVVTSGAFGYTLQGVSQSDSTNGIRFLLTGLLLAGAVGLGVAFSRN